MSWGKHVTPQTSTILAQVHSKQEDTALEIPGGQGTPKKSRRNICQCLAQEQGYWLLCLFVFTEEAKTTVVRAQDAHINFCEQV